MIARDYQIAAVDGINARWREHQSTLAVLATGLGKTFIAAMLAKEREPLGRTMFIAHREELIWQAAETMTYVFDGQPPAIEMGEYRASDSLFGAPNVVISTVQTQYAGRNGKGRMTRFDPATFATLVIDEAHHYIAPAFRRVIEHYRQNPNCKVMGITATPDRSDNMAMGRIFESVAFEYGIRAGIDDGWLVPIDQWTGTVSGIDLTEVGTVAGDLNAGELEEIMSRNGNVFAVVDQTLARVGERRALVFASGVKHAKLMAAIFNNRRASSARFICSAGPNEPGTPPDERRLILKEYAAGRVQFLCNVGIATEGFNDPGIDVIVVARPTKSRSLYTQMVGRGTRPLKGIVDQYDDATDRRCSIAESVKPSCEVIDFVGNAGRHKLITAADILGGDYDSEVVRRVKAKCTDADKAGNVAELLAEAAAALAAEKRRAEQAEADRIARLRFAHECDYRQVDPFSAAGQIDNPNRRPAPVDRGRAPTPGMLNFLAKHAPKKVNPEALSMGEAGKLIGEIKRRWESGLCSIDQSRLLRDKGLPDVVPKAQAKEWIDRIKANGWQVPHDVRRQAVEHVMGVIEGAGI